MTEPTTVSECLSVVRKRPYTWHHFIIIKGMTGWCVFCKSCVAVWSLLTDCKQIICCIFLKNIVFCARVNSSLHVWKWVNGRSQHSAACVENSCMYIVCLNGPTLGDKSLRKRFQRCCNELCVRTNCRALLLSWEKKICVWLLSPETAPSSSSSHINCHPFVRFNVGGWWHVSSTLMRNRWLLRSHLSKVSHLLSNLLFLFDILPTNSPCAALYMWRDQLKMPAQTLSCCIQSDVRRKWTPHKYLEGVCSHHLLFCPVAQLLLMSNQQRGSAWSKQETNVWKYTNLVLSFSKSVDYMLIGPNFKSYEILPYLLCPNIIGCNFVWRFS